MSKRLLLGGVALLFAISVLLLGLPAAYAGRIVPGVAVGGVSLGGLTRDVAVAKLAGNVDAVFGEGLLVLIDGKREPVRYERFGIEVDVLTAIDRAYAIGRSGGPIRRVSDMLRTVGQRHRALPAPLFVNDTTLTNEIEAFTAPYDEPGRDVRLHMSNDTIDVLFDTKPGRVLDKVALRQALLTSAAALTSTPVQIAYQTTTPHIDPTTANEARDGARRMVGDPLVLVYESRRIRLDAKVLGGFVRSGEEGSRLVADVDGATLSGYVTQLAKDINTAAQDPILEVADGKVISFVPPRPGRVLEQAETVRLVSAALLARRDGRELVSEISLPVAVREPVLEGSASDLGIKEVVGRATTSFAGSPANRISNIKNGTRFLTGKLIAPGEEFSTVTALGAIDNTTGYLPELVIKGDRTIPEFGGGLCQVSTTLFRAVMNAGLPITARRNHSYRVGYYERDGAGNYIGPGLDATIYSPNPDFRFRNDTPGHLLISGYVEGTLLTFELYGTKDGRVARIDGPHTLSTIAPGEPIIAETDTLPPGERQQLERAHPGGSAVARYRVTYADGRVEEQEFTSFYRPWPERWIVGAALPTDVNEENPDGIPQQSQP